MGNSFEVWSWEKVGEKRLDDYAYVLLYQGEDKAQAFNVLHEAKRNGCQCVKLEWRGKYEDMVKKAKLIKR